MTHLFSKLPLLLKGLLTFTFIIILLNNSNAQEQLGLRIDNYSGINATFIDPAYQSIADTDWDVNIASAGLFGTSNLVHLNNQSTFSLIRNFNNIKAEYSGKYDPEQLNENDIPVQFDYETVGTKYLAGSLNITGPSLSFKYDENHSFGFFTRMRSGFSFLNIPEEYNYTTYENNVYGTDYGLPAADFSGMIWSEIGFNYKNTQKTDYGIMTLGGNIKFLLGHEMIYANLNKDLVINQLSNNVVDVQIPELNFGYTFSAIDDNSFNTNGYGLGLDLGVSLMNSNDPNEYKWKVSTGLIDIGSISFSKKTKNYSIDKSDINRLDVEELNQISDLDTYVNELRTQLFTDFEEMVNSNTPSIWLPAALTISGDYLLFNDFYINGILIQKLPISKTQLDRSNLLAITPRYDTKYIGVSTPLSIYDYKKANVGMALRLGPLTLGTENISSLFKQSNFDSTDLYVGLRLNSDMFFKLNSGKRKTRRSRKNRNSIKCYKF